MIKLEFLVFILVLSSTFVFFIDFQIGYFERLRFEKTFIKLQSIILLFANSPQDYVEIQLPFNVNVSLSAGFFDFQSDEYSNKVETNLCFSDSHVLNTNHFNINKKQGEVYVDI